MVDDAKPAPKGEVTVGEIKIITSAPDFTLPKFLLERNIFDPAKPRPASVTANFVPKPAKGQDVSTLELQTVELFDFKFLGQNFAPSTYKVFADFGRGAQIDKKTVVGVGETLAKKLIAAQVEIFRAFARERLSVNLPIDDEKAFNAWCGIRSKNGGYGFRGGPHFGGSAIDMNVVGCPYVATGKAPLDVDPLGGAASLPSVKNAVPVVGGEMRSDQHKQEKDALKQRFVRALEAYKSAVEFVHGDDETFDLSPKSATEDPALLYNRFERVSSALSAYFSLGYDRRSREPTLLGVGEVHQPVDLDTFVARVSEFWDTDPSEPESFQAKRPSWKAGMEADRRAFLAPRYQTMQDDHEALRFVMIRGTMGYVPDPKKPDSLICDISKLSTRDPCFGFLDFRQEIAVALMNQGLRWGAAMFGPESNGDMMHFDLGHKVNPDLRPDPNPDKFGYK